MKTKNILLLLFILIFCVAFFACIIYVLQPVSNSESFFTDEVTISKGTSAKSVGLQLYERKLIRSSTVFYVIARLENPVIKAGVYKVSSNMSYTDIFTLLKQGKDAQIIVSFPEGLTISSIATILDNRGITSYTDFMKAAKDTSLLNSYHIPSHSFEGYLFPDTYFLLPDMDARQVVEIMVNNFFTKIQDVEGLTEKPDDELFNIIRLASIVEREYRREDEAPLIASVFSNRLQYNIGLYSCATIVYILTEIEGQPHPERITEKETRIESPYNTYLYAGLPPTPISNPGMTALRASANPPKTDYYYFRLIDDKTGTHSFTQNFDDHIEIGKTLSTKQQAGN